VLVLAELDMDNITAQALTFFLAGHDTTSTLLCFASHQLAVHPDIQSKLQEEIDATLQEHGGKLTHETVHSMKYLDMVVSGMHMQMFSFNASVPSVHNQQEASSLISPSPVLLSNPARY
jgi:hypothetical protein